MALSHTRSEADAGVETSVVTRVYQTAGSVRSTHCFFYCSEDINIKLTRENPHTTDKTTGPEKPHDPHTGWRRHGFHSHVHDRSK